MKQNKKGFTLIEMSIVLIVVSLILAGVLKTVSVQRQQLKRDETRQALQIINQALVGFAATEGRLPCPDTDADGESNPTALAFGNTCTSEEGFLPFVDLGVPSEDAWGNRYRYRVTSNAGTNFADNPDPGPPLLSSFAMADDGNITVRDGANNLVVNNIPALVISYAENGSQTIANLPCGAGVPSVNEEKNCDNEAGVNPVFMADDYLTDFDDLVTWVSPTVLKNRMIEAGLLGN